MEHIFVDALLTALGIIVSGLAVYVARAIVKYIVSKHLEVLAKQAVHYAEDAFKQFKGETKLRHACDWVSNIMKRYHIKIDESQIEGAVRAAYTIFVQATEKELKKEA